MMEPNEKASSNATAPTLEEIDATTKQNRRSSERLRAWGMRGTVIYLAAFAGYVVWRWDKIVALEPNAMGDLLAGAFGPLAIAWLILGFHQQGLELADNSAALRLQAAELAASVAEQKQLVAATKDQIRVAQTAFEFEKYAREQEREEAWVNAQPLITIRDYIRNTIGPGRYKVSYTIINTGATCINLQIHGVPGFFPNPNSFQTFERQSKLEIAVSHVLAENGQLPTLEHLRLSYIDATGQPSHTLYELLPKEAVYEVRILDRFRGAAPIAA